VTKVSIEKSGDRATATRSRFMAAMFPALILRLKHRRASDAATARFYEPNKPSPVHPAA